MLFADLLRSNASLLLISVLPNFHYLINEKIEGIHIENEDVISLIRKVNGSDGISGQMILLCDDSFISQHGIIYRNIVSTDIYPDMWKLANATTIFKKEDKQLIKKYSQISLKKLFLTICTNILLHPHLIRNKQSGFRPGDSATNQLIDLVSDIRHAFENYKSLEVRAMLLDIS